MQKFSVIDIGGQSVRLAVFDKRMSLLWLEKIPISTTISTKQSATFIEHDPDELITACRDLLSLCGRWSSTALSSFALATQRSSIICWDRSNGSALSNIISWQDTRATHLLNEVILQASVSESLSVRKIRQNIKKATGLYPSPHYGASKMSSTLLQMNLSFNNISAQNLLARKVTITPLISWMMAQVQVSIGFSVSHFGSRQKIHVIVDEGHAQRTMLWNIHDHQWDSKLLKDFKIPVEILPQVTCNLIKPCYFNAADKIRCELMIGDQAAALFANGLPHTDVCYINTGTGAFVLLPYDSSFTIPEELLDTIIYKDDSITLNAIEATINGAGSALLYCDQVTGVSQAQRPLYNMLEGLSNNACFLNGVGGLASPWWEPDFQSKFINCCSIFEKYQAVYESILFLIKKNFDCINKAVESTVLGTKAVDSDAVKAINKVVVSGGLSLDVRFCKALATLLKPPVYRNNIHEATVKGAAYILAHRECDKAGRLRLIADHYSDDEAISNLTLVNPLHDSEPLIRRYHFWDAAMGQAMARFERV
ncbi:Glycerol kinase [hydrothermal vent metagenome]|uniref:Glycerol kinase n=1 Tax=hydrothermal vent metagenome TaxID=652676 RepID=A0A3B0YYB6_9ZZZZ